MDTTDHGATRTATRRRMLQALGLGSAIAVLPAATQRVVAQPEPTTTAAPPKQPTNADFEVLALAQAAELAAVELYTSAISALGGDPLLPALIVFREHHEAAAESISGIGGRKAPNVASTKLIETVGDAITSDPVATLASLEHSLSATHISLLGVIAGTDAAALIASIAPAEARKAAVLAAAGGATLGDLIPASGIDDLAAALVSEDLIEA